jgi:cytochrome P450/acyl-CoA synthetase (AMP-forming)/AMP-acid ligase II
MTVTAPHDLYYDPYDVAITADPYPVLRRLRDEAPLYYNERFDFYALSRFDDVQSALVDTDTFISGKGNLLELIKADVEQPSGTLIFEDPPTHTRHRQLLARAFTPRRVAALEPQIREFTAECLDPMVGSGGFDFVQDLGAQMPMQVIGMLMGIPRGDRQTVREHVDGYLRTDPGKPMNFSKGSKWNPGSKLSAIFGEYIDWRAQHPSDDVMTDLLTAQFEDEFGVTRTLTRDEVLLYVNVVAGAGNETTNRLIGWAGKVLADHPDQRRLLVEQPGLVPNAIEELLRYESPGPIIGRYVARDVEIHGRQVRAGSAILLLAHSANRDERRYDDADRFDIERKIGHHLHFGHGIHFCLGASLTRLEGRVALEEVLQRFPEWDVDLPNARMSPTSVVRGWETMPVVTPSSARPSAFSTAGTKAGNGYLALGVDREQLTFGSFIADCAKRHGSREALVFGERRITYQELEQEVRRFARSLLAAGVTKGSSVALMLANRPEFVIAAFGVGSIGAVVVPVSTFASGGERDYVLRHSDASMLVTQSSLMKHRFVAELFESHPEVAQSAPNQIRSVAFPFLRHIVSLDTEPTGPVQSWDDFMAGADVVTEDLLDAAMSEVHPRDPGIIIYTSGTSANPKGVVHTNGTPVIQSWRWAEALGLTAEDKLLSNFPYFWSAGWTMTLGGPLAAGAAVFTMDTFDPGKALELIARERITALQAMTATYTDIVEHADFSERDLSSLTLAVGAEPLVAVLPERAWRSQTNGYGLTETFTLCTWATPEETGGEFRAIHGRPLPGIDLRIVDSETGEEVPTGQLGEIVVKGVTFMLGYHKADPEDYLDRNGYFRTGDSGHLDELGLLHWGGRLSGMIKTAGANVSPVEIESKLSLWGRLSCAVVVAVPHPRRGDAVVLCATAHGDDPVTAADVLAYLKPLVASYKVPSRVVFCDENELLYTATEKVKPADARRLAARRIAAGQDDWAAYLRGEHAELVEAETTT